MFSVYVWGEGCDRVGCLVCMCVRGGGRVVIGSDVGYVCVWGGRVVIGSDVQYMCVCGEVGWGGL